MLFCGGEILDLMFHEWLMEPMEGIQDPCKFPKDFLLYQIRRSHYREH